MKPNQNNLYARIRQREKLRDLQERRAGWHYCPDMDGMWLNPRFPAMADKCSCGRKR